MCHLFLTESLSYCDLHSPAAAWHLCVFAFSLFNDSEMDLRQASNCTISRTKQCTSGAFAWACCSVWDFHLAQKWAQGEPQEPVVNGVWISHLIKIQGWVSHWIYRGLVLDFWASIFVISRANQIFKAEVEAEHSHRAEEQNFYSLNDPLPLLGWGTFVFCWRSSCLLISIRFPVKNNTAG